MIYSSLRFAELLLEGVFDCIALYRTSVAMYIVQLLKLYFVQVTISDILLYILYCTVFLCIVFLMLQPCVVHGYYQDTKL